MSSANIFDADPAILITHGKFLVFLVESFSRVSSQLPPVRVAVAVHMPSSCASRGGALEHIFMHGKN